MPSTGDEVMLCIAQGAWAKGRVMAVPKSHKWSQYANALRNDPPSGIWKLAPAEREAVGITEEGSGGAAAAAASAAPAGVPAAGNARAAARTTGRARKAPESYDASKTSTEYTRELRVKENDDEERRRAWRVVEMGDGGDEKIALLSEETKWSRWVFLWAVSYTHLTLPTTPYV